MPENTPSQDVEDRDLEILEKEDESKESKDETKETKETKSKGAVDEKDVETIEVDEEEPKETEKDEEKDEETKEVKEEVRDEKLEKVARTRPSIKQVTEKYPNLFKDFPELKESIYRETEFARIFPTADDAVEAFEKAEEFEKIEDALVGGDIESLLTSVEQGSKDSFKSIATKFLPVIHKKDPNLYLQITAPVVDSFIKALYKYGAERKDEDIQNAARYAAIFGFEDEDYATGKKHVAFVQESRKTPEMEKFERDKESYLSKRHSEMKSSVDSHAGHVVMMKIVDNLDPQKLLGQFSRDKVIEEIFAQVDDTLSRDDRHMKLMNTLWKKARKTNYSSEMQKRISTAFLSRAIPLIPAIRSKVLSKALADRTTTQQGNEEEQVKIKPSGSKPQPQLQSMPKNLDPSRIDRKKTSDLDILEGKITLKK